MQHNNYLQRFPLSTQIRNYLFSVKEKMSAAREIINHKFIAFHPKYAFVSIEVPLLA